ncbi:MAG: copper chaperone PCu(A)C [Ignavibacteriales bacterium]|nr:copper chaperone PCu(A)C [Ignavibacteriales bacterium]
MNKSFLLIAAITFSSINLFSQPITNHKSLITIKDVWARPGAKNANSALYFTVQNNGSKADTILGAKSKYAEIVEVHETFKRDNDRMGMRQVKFVAVPANSKLEFKPGGFHVMLINLYKDVKTGSSLEATLNFKYAGKIKVKAVVRDMPGV